MSRLMGHCHFRMDLYKKAYMGKVSLKPEVSTFQDFVVNGFHCTKVTIYVTSASYLCL